MREIAIDNPPLEVHGRPASRLATLPFIYASVDTTAGVDEFSIRLYHCPTDPKEELRLTWDALRKHHAGFCKTCRKLWPLPRRILTAAELRAIADKRQLEFTDLT